MFMVTNMPYIISVDDVQKTTFANDWTLISTNIGKIGQKAGALTNTSTLCRMFLPPKIETKQRQEIMKMYLCQDTGLSLAIILDRKAVGEGKVPFAVLHGWVSKPDSDQTFCCGLWSLFGARSCFIQVWASRAARIEKASYWSTMRTDAFLLQIEFSPI